MAETSVFAVIKCLDLVEGVLYDSFVSSSGLGMITFIKLVIMIYLTVAFFFCIYT